MVPEHPRLAHHRGQRAAAHAPPEEYCHALAGQVGFGRCQRLSAEAMEEAAQETNVSDPQAQQALSRYRYKFLAGSY